MTQEEWREQNEAVGTHYVLWISGSRVNLSEEDGRRVLAALQEEGIFTQRFTGLHDGWQSEGEDGTETLSVRLMLVTFADTGADFWFTLNSVTGVHVSSPESRYNAMLWGIRNEVLARGWDRVLPA